MTTAITALLALLFLMTGAMKLARTQTSLEMREHLGVPEASWPMIGLLEVAGATGAVIGLAFRPLGVAAAGGLVLLALGAIVSHARVRDRAIQAAPAVFALLLAAGTLALQAAG